MAKNESKDLTAPVSAPSVGLAPSDVANLSRFLDSGFSEEKAFWIGDPADGKVGIYFGELVGEGEPVMLEQMGGKPDPSTGEVPMQAIPCFLFHPLDPMSFQPQVRRTDNVICSAAVAAACRRYKRVADKLGGTAQLLIRWNGKGRSKRSGFEFNQIDIMFRIVGPNGAIVEAGSLGGAASNG